MTTIGPSALGYDPLPIDNSAGFPQHFPFLLNGVRYQFSLYVDAPETALGDLGELMVLPDAHRFLVVRVEVLGPDSTRQTVFLRKVVPSLEYAAGALALVFPTQIVARRNLNNAGNYGTTVVGGGRAR